MCLHLRFLTVVMDRSYDISIGAARVRRVRRRDGRRRCLDRQTLDSSPAARLDVSIVLSPAGIGTHTEWHTDISIGICAGSRVSPRQNVEVRGLSSYL